MAHRLTYDRIHTSRPDRAGGAWRVRIYQIDVAGPGRVAVLLLTGPAAPIGAGTTLCAMSMTDAVPELLTRRLSWALEEEVPPMVIEHRTRDAGAGDTFDLVTFDRWTPRIERRRGEDRISLGMPRRERLDPADVAALLGDTVVGNQGAAVAHDRAGSR